MNNPQPVVNIMGAAPPGAPPGSWITDRFWILADCLQIQVNMSKSTGEVTDNGFDSSGWILVQLSVISLVDLDVFSSIFKIHYVATKNEYDDSSVLSTMWFKSL